MRDPLTSLGDFAAQSISSPITQRCLDMVHEKTKKLTDQNVDKIQLSVLYKGKRIDPDTSLCITILDDELNQWLAECLERGSL